MDEMSGAKITLIVLAAIFVCAFIVGVGCWAVPQYNVWERGLSGKAELAKAEYNRRIAVQEAEAKMDAAKKLADAEVIRAEGVAKANKIIGDSLHGNEAYLRYLWINNLESNNPTVIYVPTEGGLPILEAGHRPAMAPAR